MRRLFVRLRITGYTTEKTKVEGGPIDRKDGKLQTYKQYKEGEASWVSVAIDSALDWLLPYGTKGAVYFDGLHNIPVPIRCVDHGDDFEGKGLTRMDVCAGPTQKDANDDMFNQTVYVEFWLP